MRPKPTKRKRFFVFKEARYFVRLFTTFFVKFKGILLLGIILGILAFVGLRFLVPAITFGRTERVGIAGRFRPDSLPDEILNLIGGGLTKLDKSGVVEPGLATSWETPDKGKTWYFHLDEDIRWQDGEKLKASDLNYEFSDVEVEKKDPDTIIFKLQNPFSPFPGVVSKPVFKRGLLGTGEWEVKNIRLSGNFVQKITLVNGHDKKIYKFYPTEDRSKLAFKLGEVDKITNILNNTPFAAWKTAQVNQSTDQGIVIAVFFNTSNPVLGEKSFRQALSYAINKDEFEGERAFGPISPLSWVYNPQVKAYTYNPDRAKELVDDTEPFNKDSKIKLVTTPVLLPVAELIAKNWQEAGVNTVVQVSSGIPIEYEALLVMFDTPKDPDQYSIWHSTQTSTNISKYQNPRVDKLLEDGRSEIGQETRRKNYLDFQRFLVEDSPAVFLYHPFVYTIKRK